MRTDRAHWLALAVVGTAATTRGVATTLGARDTGVALLLAGGGLVALAAGVAGYRRGPTLGPSASVAGRGLRLLAVVGALSYAGVTLLGLV